MRSSVIIREATREDVPAIASLLNSMYRLQRPREFYSWQFFENTNPSKLVCGFSGSDVIGTFGVQKRALTNGLACGQLSWLNIAPKWQGKGWFRRLGEAALAGFDGLDVLCIFANSGAKAVSQRSFGFKITGAIKMLQLSDLNKIKGAPAGYETINRKTRFKCVDNTGDQTVMLRASQEFRRWRYALNPMYTYDRMSLESGEFVITKKFIDREQGVCYGDIVDLECRLNDTNKLGALYRMACAHLKKEGAGQITTWAIPGSPLRGVVEKLGFMESGHETYWAVKTIKKDFDYLYDLSRWHLKQCDATNY